LDDDDHEGDNEAETAQYQSLKLSMTLVVISNCAHNNLVVNLVTEKVIKTLTFFEKRFTHTSWELSLVYKLSLAKFLNTCLIPIVGYSSDEEWFGKNGLVEEVHMVIFAIIAGEILRICLYPKFVWKWIVRTIETRRGEQSNITQKEANYLYENDEASIGKSMSVMFIFLLTILFYSPIMPGITVLGIVGSSILYWVLKIVILKRNVIMRQID
jgi:hypothetical protein